MEKRARNSPVQKRRPSRKRSIDRVDLKILRILQRNARITHTALASEVGLSITPCKERVKALEAAGVIEGYYTARVNPANLELGLLVFVEITSPCLAPRPIYSTRSGKL